MALLSQLKPERVFFYFEQLSAIPRGSGNMTQIADYCMEFAQAHHLKAVRDHADNVVIFKPASPGYETSDPMILQGHLDMVCQKRADCEIDFTKQGPRLSVDDTFVTACGTTLGADNGIAVAMILAILENNLLPHPAIEAVLTTDEEIGMIGASKLDMQLLTAHKMINLDSEAGDTVTVSCAGGSEFKACLAITRTPMQGTELVVVLQGLQGGHSGIEIDKGRVNAAMLAGRFLDAMKDTADFALISIDGGDKANAIANRCEIRLCSENPTAFIKSAEAYFSLLKQEIACREHNFAPAIEIGSSGTFEVLTDEVFDRLVFALVCAPNGVIEMSTEIKGLVETSLNLGILQTEQSNIVLSFALRSNKRSAMRFLEQRLRVLFTKIGCQIETSGHYPPWEFKENSALRQLYHQVYTQQFGHEPKVEAIHAGLECGLFAAGIENFDCIAIGPNLYDVHTVNEKLSISSTEQVFKLLLTILEKSK